MSDFLVGKIIKGIKIAKDKQALLFVCEDGEHIVKCDADCCSQTWIESVDLPALGFPCNVVSQKDLHLNLEPLSNDEFECCQFYGHEIVTDKGAITIDYRNESNGYYGGDLSWPDEYFYGGVYAQCVSNEEWESI